MSLYLNCEETSALLSDYLDGHLPPWTRFKVWLHLLFCPSCSAILATLRILPHLMADLGQGEPSAPPEAEAALDAALARIRESGSARLWPASPVPPEARLLLEERPDLPLSLLAQAHREVALGREPAAGPYHLPKGILDHLPPQDQWRWVDDLGGRRRVELLKDPEGGQRLVLSYAPPGAKSPAHRHLGSESILVLAGTLRDTGVCLRPGDWVHHPDGSVHATVISGEDCWCLIREEGSAASVGPLERLRLMGRAS